MEDLSKGLIGDLIKGHGAWGDGLEEEVKREETEMADNEEANKIEKQDDEVVDDQAENNLDIDMV